MQENVSTQNEARYTALEEAIRILQSGTHRQYKEYQNYIGSIASKADFVRQYGPTIATFEKVIANEGAGHDLFEGLNAIERGDMEVRLYNAL